MTRIFKHPHSEWTEVTELNTETGGLLRYCESEGLRFSNYNINIFEIGWKSAHEFIVNRRNKAWGWKERKAS